MKKISITRLKSALIFASIVFFAINLTLILCKFENNKIFYFEILFGFFALFFTTYLSTFNLVFFRIFTILILFLVLTNLFCFNEYAIILDQNIVLNLFENIDNFFEVVLIFNFLKYFLPFLFLSFLIFKIKFKDKINRKILIYFLIIFLIFVTIFSFQKHIIRKGIIFSYPPISCLQTIIKYFQENYEIKNNYKNLIPIEKIIDAKIDKNKIKNLKIILVIGESARSKNFSINGYGRITNPKISKLKNFISFKNVEPCANSTAYSVSCMLSVYKKSQFSFPPKEESVIKLFSKLNFSTSYYSTQKAVGDSNSIMKLAMQSDNYHFFNYYQAKFGGKMIYDEYLLDDLKNQLATDFGKNSFIILHTQGSHFLFDDRYSEKFKSFTPTCVHRDVKKCNLDEIKNSYDNSILYTDNFLSQIVEKLQNENAIMIYISDHGQFLGENKIYYHGPNDSVNSEFHKVPMFFWMSDKLLENKFYKNKFLVAKKKINNNLSHDNLFDSLTGCSGIDVKKKKYGICDKII